jgi:8-oxo-dGTP pyrophosphatase MutT (NUDIX family)
MSKYPQTVGSWQRLDSDVRYENLWIRVSHENVTTPAGTDGIYGVVHFKGTAIGVVPLDEEGNTWLVGQYRYTLDAYSWEIPMGGCPEGELPLVAAQRELQEETGLGASEWVELMDVHTSNSVTDEGGKVFVATGLTEGDMDLEPTEDITVRKLPVTEALAMAQRGEITDCISVAALYRLAYEGGW